MLRNTLNLQLLFSFILLFSHDATLQALELTNTIWTSHDLLNPPYTTVGNYGGTSPVVTWTPLDAPLISPFNGNIVTLNWSTVNFTNNSGDFSIVDTGTSNAVLAGIPSSTPPGVATFSFSFATPVNNPYIFMRVNGSSYSSLMQMVFDDGASNNYNLHMIGWSSNFSMSSQDVVSTSGSVNDGFIAQVLGTNISTIRLTTQNSNSLVQWQFSVAVPEPSTYVMMFGSVLVLGLTGFRKRKAGKFALNS